MRTLVFLGILIFGLSSAVQAEQGIAELKGIKDNSQIRGVVSFIETEGGLKIRANIERAPEGRHGFHIHEFGSCDSEGREAGSHYNPGSTQHGLLASDGFENAHAGDLGNLDIDHKGRGNYETLLSGLSLSGGEHSVGGRAVILHENPDDFGQPTGNAGSRIACGVIRITGK